MRQPALKPRAVVRGLDGARGQFGDRFNLLTEHPSPAQAGGQAGATLPRTDAISPVFTAKILGSASAITVR